MPAARITICLAVYFTIRHLDGFYPVSQELVELIQEKNGFDRMSIAFVGVALNNPIIVHACAVIAPSHMSSLL